MNIGTTEMMSAGIIPAVINRLSRQFPRLTFNVLQARTLDLQYRDLRDRTVDLVLGRLPGPVVDADLNVEILLNDPLLIAAGLSNKWVRRRRVAAAELIDEAWCLPAYGGLVMARLEEAFRAKGLELPKHRVGSTSIQLFNALLATGNFLSVYSTATLDSAASVSA